MSTLGSKGGAVVRALASHQRGPGSNPGVDAICGLSLLLVLSFAPRGFSPGTLVLPLSSKTNIFKFQFDQESGRLKTTMWTCYQQIVIYLFIYLFLFYLVDRVLGGWEGRGWGAVGCYGLNCGTGTILRILK